MNRIAVVTFSSDILPSYVYIPSEDNPADAPSGNVRTAKFGTRGARPVIGRLPVKNKYVKHKVSNQERGLPWWVSSDDLVNDFLTNCCPDGRDLSRMSFFSLAFALWKAAELLLFLCVFLSTLDDGRLLVASYFCRAVV